MPELTVCMIANDSARHLEQAIDSILKQQGIDFEVVIIDNGADADTSAIVKSFSAPRVRIIRNEARLRTAYCYNQLIVSSSATYIAFMGAEDIMLPRAQERIVRALGASPDIGLAHGYSFEIDERGHITKDRFRSRRSFLVKHRKPEMDYKRALFLSGEGIDRFQGYRREALLAVGGFDETLDCGANFDLWLRLLDRYEVGLIPEFLYCYRYQDQSRRNRVRAEELTMWQKYSLCQRRRRNKQVSFLREARYDPVKLLIAALGQALWRRRPSVRRRLVSMCSSLKNLSNSLAATLWANFDQ